MNSPARPSADPIENSVNLSEKFEPIPARNQRGIVVSLQPKTAPSPEAVRGELDRDRLLTAEQVAERLNVTKDWVWDHSSRKSPYLPVIRIGDGTLRFRASKIEEFINERERLSVLRRKRR